MGSERWNSNCPQQEKPFSSGISIFLVKAAGTCLVSMLYSILILFIPSMLPGDSRRMETMVRRLSYESSAIVIFVQSLLCFVLLNVRRIFVFRIIILLRCTLPMVLLLAVSSLFANRISYHSPTSRAQSVPYHQRWRPWSIHFPFHPRWHLYCFACCKYLQPWHQACIMMDIQFLPYLPAQSALPGKMICACSHKL